MMAFRITDAGVTDAEGEHASQAGKKRLDVQKSDYIPRYASFI
ncbi:MAG: hypothetical protein A4E39_01328 [Methanoregulaceae archaeon PtaB.Bin152]|nr:MAG: hypothetical protein A4E39_01328 [Methanoregulaceae archaeon PtaB.Bin152]